MFIAGSSVFNISQSDLPLSTTYEYSSEGFEYLYIEMFLWMKYEHSLYKATFSTNQIYHFNKIWIFKVHLTGVYNTDS